MAFIRVKKIRKNGKEYEYAYLVANTWKKRKQESRQKVSKYLGKVIRLDKVKDDPIVLGELSRSDTVKMLVRHELLLRGFSEKERVLEKEGIIFDTTRISFNPKIIIEMNEGFLSEFTLKQLLAFRRKQEDDREDAIRLANLFLEAGLKIPNEAFVRYFEKSG